MPSPIHSNEETPVAIFDENGNLLVSNDKDARIWATLCHISGGLVVFQVPFLHILGPLAVWSWKKNEYSFVADQGKEALNFQISMALYGLVGWILTMVLIGWLILGILVVINLILIIDAALKTKRGEKYRYPFNLRLIG